MRQVFWLFIVACVVLVTCQASTVQRNIEGEAAVAISGVADDIQVSKHENRAVQDSKISGIWFSWVSYGVRQK
jgi:hypothetical protein